MATQRKWLVCVFVRVSIVFTSRHSPLATGHQITCGIPRFFAAAHCTTRCSDQTSELMRPPEPAGSPALAGSRPGAVMTGALFDPHWILTRGGWRECLVSFFSASASFLASARLEEPSKRRRLFSQSNVRRRAASRSSCVLVLKRCAIPLMSVLPNSVPGAQGSCASFRATGVTFVSFTFSGEAGAGAGAAACGWVQGRW